MFSNGFGSSGGDGGGGGSSGNGGESGGGGEGPTISTATAPINAKDTSNRICFCESNNEIHLRVISSQIFGAILDFVYTGNIVIDEENVQVSWITYRK